MIKNFVHPVLALSLICLVMVGAMIFVNDATMAAIQGAGAAFHYEPMLELLPDADEFVQLDIAGMPGSIVMAYRAANGEGYIFVAQVYGFGGAMQIMSGLARDGSFVASTVLSHNETASFMEMVFEYRDAQEARGRSLLQVDEISGATITFRAYQEAIRYALAAFETAGGQ